MPQFEIAYFSGQIFWLALLFTLLYLMISLRITPKMKHIIEDRAKEVNGNLETAQILAQEMEKMELQKNQILLDLRAKEDESRIQALERIDLYLKQQEQDFYALSEVQRSNIVAQLHKQEQDFKNHQDENYINLASMIIEKISNKKADLSVLNKIYSGMK